jgi:chromosome partitioning protein
MTVYIGMISQKGGVGKSTLSRLVAREYANAGWSVKIADLDISQGTCFDWQGRRMEHCMHPEIPVERFRSASAALKISHIYDLMIFDGKPYASSQTLDIAKACDLLILPTGLSLDDLRPSVLLANELCENGISKQKFSFAFCRTGDSEPELEEARRYVADAGYSAFDRAMPEKTAYRRASDTGRAPTETKFASLNKKADELAQSIINKVTQLQEEKTREAQEVA